MRRLGWIVIMVVALTATGNPAWAEEPTSSKGRIGLGFVLGEPSGVSLKWHLDADRSLAVEGRFGVGVLERGVGGQVGMWWAPTVLTHGCVTNERFAVPLYFGVAARLFNHQRVSTSTRDRHLGGSAVIGVALDFEELPVELFAEVGGVVDHVDADDDHGGFPYLGVMGGLGMRYYP